jgi:hypothetical protein
MSAWHSRRKRARRWFLEAAAPTAVGRKKPRGAVTACRAVAIVRA